MRFSYAVLPLAAIVGALEVTSPTKGEDVDVSNSFTVKWDSVNTDASSFNLYIVNNAVYPPVEQKIASDVDTSKGSYTVSSLSGLTDGKGYQINLVSDVPQNSGILAQSQQFDVKGASDSSSSSSSSASASTSTSTSSSSSSSSSSSASTTLTSTASSSTGTASTLISTTAQTTSSGAQSSTARASTPVASTNRVSPSGSATPSSTVNGTAPTASVHPGAGASLAAPLSAVAGLVMGVMALTL
ncbi:GPI anchored serine-threonine rich family protein [Aspergillus homomorphus CBS 101889]|uniref:Yeast cell wall synthesis Kre9/Knh1-like N-terminal domain-containing protein n=1 Tax=Aspergillus homomorphus (strain CBS 101889) TaxID=1450537 RepID=A0A395HGY5_ASPHC|nr:hypothetical protein BO97DRAFT_438823 [Aspergillus homomorphus CBS 101889]RAL06906.1 hypothetical protein BO97DRAFT_438823 [Aspergillus homomorphus CBS 101889]